MMMQAKDGITTKRAAEMLGLTEKQTLQLLSPDKSVRRMSRALNQQGQGGMKALWHREDVERVQYGREHYKPKVNGETFVVGHPAMLKPWSFEGMSA